MYGLPEEINNKLKKGCTWQGYLLDTSIEFGQIPMLVETTLMKFGSSPGGLVGLTLKPKSVVRLAYSFHKLSAMIKNFKDIYERTSNTGKHKEEGNGRIKAFMNDRMKFRNKLSVSINSFEETGGDFSRGIVNIVTGKVSPETNTNIHDCLKIGNEQLTEFRSSLPDGFIDKVECMIMLAGNNKRKHNSADGSRETSDVGAIYNRLLMLNQTSNMSIDMREVLKYELILISLSMFKTDGSPRIIK